MAFQESAAVIVNDPIRRAAFQDRLRELYACVSVGQAAGLIESFPVEDREVINHLIDTRMIQETLAGLGALSIGGQR
jgi:hypothetical protein